MITAPNNDVGRFPATSSRAELAGLFGVSVRTISDLIARGVVVRTSKKGQYETITSLHRYLDGLRETAAGRSNDVEVGGERLRINTVNRKIAEMKLGELEGTLVPIDEVVEAWGSILSRVKSSLLSIPAQLRTSITHFGAHEQEMAKTLIRDVLNEMADEIEAGAIGTDTGDLREADEAPERPKRDRKARG